LSYGLCIECEAGDLALIECGELMFLLTTLCGDAAMCGGGGMSVLAGEGVACGPAEAVLPRGEGVIIC